MSRQFHRVVSGRYADSVVLMRLQQSLAERPGIREAAAMMATAANREILEQGGWWPGDLGHTRADDLLVVVRADREEAAGEALAAIEELLQSRSDAVGEAYRYRSLERALRDHPEAEWVAVSVPGEHAAGVAREALAAERNIFLYSDNVGIEDEVALKREASRRGRLVLGPDCGTTAIGGLGLGFCNRFQPGPVGLVGASGTGLQAVIARLDELGVGLSQVLGTGGRDLKSRVGAITMLAGLDLLDRDPATRVIGLVSKPPDPEVASRVLSRALAASKPVVICFLGLRGVPDLGPVRVVGSLEEAAAAAAAAVEAEAARSAGSSSSGFFRGLFSGGTLALEVAGGLATWLRPLATNLGLASTEPLEDPERSRGHTIVDLGADELTRGRPHPMIDPTLRDRRLAREAGDPEVGTILLDVVLGDGAHADPAAGLARELESAFARSDRSLEIGILLIGTREDPQGLDGQGQALEATGARVFRSPAAATRWVLERTVRAVSPAAGSVALAALEEPVVINVGVEAFAASVVDQGGRAIQVDWRPAAGGDAGLARILERMRAGEARIQRSDHE